MKIVAVLLNVVFLPLALVAGRAQREIDEKNGVVWLYERGSLSGIIGVEGVANNLLSLKIPVKLGGTPMSAISAGAFKSCEYITNVIVPAGIRLVGKESFANCSNLVGVAMEGGRDCVKLIGSGAFRDCKKMEALELPDGLENVACDAFHGCDALRKVVLPTNCIYGIEGFSNCRGLERMDVGGVFEFDENHGILVGCESLAEIVVPASNRRFEVLDGILYTSDGVSLVRCPPKLAANEIKVREGVLKICPRAFENCGVTSVVLPDSLDSIDCGAFYGCTNLRTITIPANVRVIRQGAFDGCRNLKQVRFLGNERPSIEDDAFPSGVRLDCINSPPLPANDRRVHVYPQNGGGFTFRKVGVEQVEICSLDGHCAYVEPRTLRIPDVIDGCKVTHIASQAFAYDQRIVAVEIGSNVCQIGRRAFCGCSNLVSVSMSDCAFSPMRIYGEAFYQCGRMESLKLPEGLKFVGERAFAECSSLKDVRLPDSCDTMCEDTFWNCQALQSVHMALVGRYDESRLLSAFLDCPALKKISVHPDNPAYAVHAGALYYKDMKAIVRCPPMLEDKVFAVRGGVKAVCPFAFESCRFTEITLPDGLVGIGQDAFPGCNNLAAVSIPSSVEVIDDYAFRDCTNLLSVIMNASEMPLMGKDVFPVCTKVVHLPMEREINATTNRSKSEKKP